MNDSPGSLEQLSNRIDDLERRVHALEHPEELKVAESAHPDPDSRPIAQIAEPDLQTGRIFPVLGRAMLGVSGAYVLRAVTTAGAAPRLLVSAIAVLYALGWLVWALRTSQTLSRYVYAGTSALILAPMLWEVTLRFNVLTAMTAAGVLAAFVTLATVLDLHPGDVRTAWILQGTATIMAASLAFATHHVLPFLLTLLIAVFVIEYERARGFSEPAWPLIVLVSDAAIWGMIFIYSGPQSARAEYVELSSISLVIPGCLLFAINGTSVAVKVTLHSHRIGIFETAQLLIAFLLAIASVLFFTPNHGELAVGLSSLVLATAIYPVIFLRFQRLADLRNFWVFGTWCAALVVAGAVWTMQSGGAAAILLAIAGCLAFFLGAHINSRMLELHGAVFLCAAVAVSEMSRYVFGALASSLPERPRMSVFVISIAAALAFMGDRELEESPGTAKVLQFVPAMVAACGVSALLAHGVLALSALAVVPEAQHLAFLRTFTVSIMSLSFAFAGSRWGWVAMTKLAYVALVFVAAKLLFEDLRHGHMVFIAGSISLFAISLIAVPRMVRWGAKARQAHSHEALAPPGS